MTDKIIIAYKNNRTKEKMKKLTNDPDFNIKSIDFLIKDCIDKEDISILNIFLAKANRNQINMYAEYALKKGKNDIYNDLKTKLNEQDHQYFIKLYEGRIIKNMVDHYINNHFEGLIFEDFEDDKKADLVKKTLELNNLSY